MTALENELAGREIELLRKIESLEDELRDAKELDGMLRRAILYVEGKVSSLTAKHKVLRAAAFRVVEVAFAQPLGPGYNVSAAAITALANAYNETALAQTPSPLERTGTISKPSMPCCDCGKEAGPDHVCEGKTE